MAIDWDLVLKVAMPVITLFLGVAINRYLEGREKLISHLGHIASFRIAPMDPGSQPTLVHTHSVVLRNAGRRAAKNVRLGHNFLPNINVYPDIEYKVVDLPGGAKELVFPILAPKKEVTISYLYFPPDTWDRVNTHVESEEGPAKVVKVLLSQQPHPWVIRTVWFLLVFGVVAVIYALIEGVRATAT